MDGYASMLVELTRPLTLSPKNPNFTKAAVGRVLSCTGPAFFYKNIKQVTAQGPQIIKLFLLDAAVEAGKTKLQKVGVVKPGGPAAAAAAQSPTQVSGFAVSIALQDALDSKDREAAEHLIEVALDSSLSDAAIMKVVIEDASLRVLYVRFLEPASLQRAHVLECLGTLGAVTLMSDEAHAARVRKDDAYALRMEQKAEGMASAKELVSFGASVMAAMSKAPAKRQAQVAELMGMAVGQASLVSAHSSKDVKKARKALDTDEP
jgi:hypothetical protein